MELLGIEMSLEEFDALMVAQNNGKQLKVVETEELNEDGNKIKKVVAVGPEPYVPTTEDKINELKQKLSEADYVSNKLAEAIAKYIVTDDKTELTKLYTEYKDVLDQKQQWRDEINELESNNG